MCSLDSHNLRETSISSSKVPIHLHRLVTLITLSLPYTLPPLPSNLHNSTGRPCPSSFTPPLPYALLQAITSSPFSLYLAVIVLPPSSECGDFFYNFFTPPYFLLLLISSVPSGIKKKVRTLLSFCPLFPLFFVWYCFFTILYLFHHLFLSSLYVLPIHPKSVLPVYIGPVTLAFQRLLSILVFLSEPYPNHAAPPRSPAGEILLLNNLGLSDVEIPVNYLESVIIAREEGTEEKRGDRKKGLVLVQFVEGR